jgi:hypothetical protein
MSMSEAVAAALAADPPADQDTAVAALATLYAATIDDQGDAATVKDLGPKLLAALESLQLSPRARALARLHALTEKGPIDAANPSGGLDELRARRRARKRNAQTVDPAAT